MDAARFIRSRVKVTSFSQVGLVRREWAEKVNAENPEFFPEMAKGQTPEYLWIGCADSRVTVSTDNLTSDL